MKTRYEVRAYDEFGEEIRYIDELIETMKDARYFADLCFRSICKGKSLQILEGKKVKIYEVVEDEDGEIIYENEVETIEYPFEKVIVKAGTYDCDETKDEITFDKAMRGVVVDHYGSLTVKLDNGYHISNVDREEDIIG